MERLIILLNILLLKQIKSEYEKCTYAFHCEKEQMENICLKKVKTESDGIFEIILNSRPNYSCNAYNALIGDTEKTITFQDNEYNNLTLKRSSYLSGKCFNNSDCLNGICKDSVCFNYYNICYSHEDCPFGTFCNNANECQNYLQDNEYCVESYQCKFNSFCDKKYKICRKLFSYEDGTDITEVIGQNDDINFDIGEICRSGGYIEIVSNSEKKYYCETLLNENYSCKNNCTYKRKSNNESIILENKCLCGYNKYRTKNCLLGNGEQEFIDYLKIRKNFLFNDNYIKKCHTLERDSNEICNELINTNLTVAFREYTKNYKNLKIKALEYHRIKDSDNCVKEVIFGYNNNPVIPIKQKCPKFICDKNIDQCLYGINQFDEDGNNITIKLNENICSVNEQCTINKGILASNDLMNIMENKNIEGKCNIYFYWSGIRYPGEKCNIDSDCIDNSTCIDGKCSGKENGESCKDTKECKVGHYCNNTCIPQKSEGERCNSGWDCENYLGCYKGRCIKFGTLKPGVLNSQEYSPFPGNEKRHYLCNTGELDGDDGTTGNFCVKSKYSEDWIKKYNKTKDKKGFIKCEYKESCFYDNGKRTIEKKCGCGYNSDGQGYCPLPSSLRIDEWNERIKFIADFANNNCHTLSRFNCYEQNSMKDFIKIKQHDKKTIDAHLFYKAVPCAEKMFSSGNYLKSEILFFALFILYLY